MTKRDPLNLAGQVIAEKYQIERLVGEGGFAVVYRALHAIWKKPVAIKFFNGLSSAPEELREGLQQAFIQEGALLTELSSQTAGIVQARDVGACTTPNGQWVPYMVLEWLEGSSLEDVLLADRRQGMAWSLAETMGFFGRVLPALEVAHARGIAHRDIKPANLFVLGSAARSSQTPIKLLDFGVAKMVSDHAQFKAALAKTGVGITSFTPRYGAPEQFTRSYGATGPWTDVYAMALVAVEMMTAKDALQGEDLVQLGFATANPDKRPTPRSRGVEVPDAVEEVFLRALAVQPGERYASAGEFLEAFLATAEIPDSALRGQRDSSRVFTPASVPHVDSPANPDAPTVVEPAPSPPVPGAPSALTRTSTAAAAAPMEPRNGSKLATFLAALTIIASATALFAASDLDGAAETRVALFKMARQVGIDVEGSSVPTVGAASAEPSSSAALFAGANSAVPAGSASTAAPDVEPAPPTCPETMASVPGASFPLGSARDGEGPVHQVELAPYCIDLKEVTAGDYADCVKARKCPRPRNRVSWPGIRSSEHRPYSGTCTFGVSKREDYPINCVNWEMAFVYCKFRDQRLPTEAEWERAARGPDLFHYAWGAQAPSERTVNGCGKECVDWARRHGLRMTALYQAEDGYPTLAPVALFEHGRSEFGLYDTAGNVWEWVSDWHAEYTSDAQVAPKGPKRGKLKVIRGGGWDTTDATELGASFRRPQHASSMSHSIGFRCASTPPAATDAQSTGRSPGSAP